MASCQRITTAHQYVWYKDRALRRGKPPVNVTVTYCGLTLSQSGNFICSATQEQETLSCGRDLDFLFLYNSCTDFLHCEQLGAVQPWSIKCWDCMENSNKNRKSFIYYHFIADSVNPRYFMFDLTNFRSFVNIHPLLHSKKSWNGRAFITLECCHSFTQLLRYKVILRFCPNLLANVF